MRAGVAPIDVPAAPFPVRIRHVLGLALLALVVWSAAPRARAAWALPSAATAFADYALCMVGPLGPSLLRDNPSEFRRLARRRLIVVGAGERPFARCAKAAGTLTGSPSVERAHLAVAGSFVEYGGGAVGGASITARLEDLAVTTHRLAELSVAAWPFFRSGYTALVQPSAYAAEAPHPAELPRAGAARGLPPARALLSGGRCEASGPSGAFVLGLSTDRRSRVARTVTPEGVTSDAVFAASDARILAAVCDERTLLVASQRPGATEALLSACAYLGGCANVPLPRLSANGPAIRFPFDVARVSGVTVVAVPMQGIVRVASSRDDGRSWTPFIVAFDREAHPELRFDVPVPDRLTLVGHRLWLHGVATRPSQTYPTLTSDDAGASWRAP